MTPDARALLVSVWFSVSIALAMLAWPACLPSPQPPRLDATDATWTPAVLPPGFDAGGGGGHF